MTWGGSTAKFQQTTQPEKSELAQLQSLARNARLNRL